MTYYSFTWRKTVAKTVVFTNVKVVIYKLTRALVVKSVDTKDLKSLPIRECRFESCRGHHKLNDYLLKKVLGPHLLKIL